MISKATAAVFSQSFTAVPGCAAVAAAASANYRTLLVEQRGLRKGRDKRLVATQGTAAL